MVLFDFLLLVNLNFTISHDDFIGQTLKRPNLLAEWRFWKSCVWSLIKTLIGLGFYVWRDELLAGPVAGLSRINWQSWYTLSITIKTLHTPYLCVCGSRFYRVVVGAFIESFGFLIRFVSLDLQLDLVKNFSVIFFRELFTWEKFLAFFLNDDL